MADVSARLREAREGRDRGQLILVTGLAVAVTLVAIVMLLNTVIYTQNLASRGTSVGDGDAVGFRSEVVSGVGGLIDAENRVGYETQAKVEDNVSAGVERFDALLSRRYGERGTIAAIETDTLATTEGTILRQTNASRTLNSSGGKTDWQLADDVTNVRRVRFTVSRETLSDSVDDSFSVRLVGNNGNIWEMHAFDDNGDVAVAVKENDGEFVSLTTVCSVSGPEATIDLTAGTLNGTTCPGLDYAAGLSTPYDVQFRNGENATGTYELTVDTTTAGVDVAEANFAAPGAGESPWAAPAVYDAAFEIHFETPTLTFHTTVRVARGEPA